MNINGQFLQAGINIQLLLESFGVERISEYQQSLKCLCPFREEKTPSFYFHLDKGLFHCFGCGVEGDIVSFVQLKRGCSVKEASQWLMEFCGMAGDPESFFKSLERYADSNRFIREVKYFAESQQSHPVYDESLIAQLTSARREFYLDKGFTPEILDEFEVGYAVDAHFTERLFFPIRDAEGGLVGVSGRRLDLTKEFKWVHSADLVKKNLLYNLNRAKKYAMVDQRRELILTEGPVDCMRAAMYGKKNIVALLGHTCSVTQRRILMQHALEVVLALDSDAAGQEGTREAIQLLWGAFKLFVMRLPDQKDVGELTQEEFDQCYQNKERIVTKGFSYHEKEGHYVPV